MWNTSLTSMADIRNIQTISKNILFQDNKNLCYINTIDWSAITSQFREINNFSSTNSITTELLYSGNLDLWIYDKVLIWIPVLIILLVIPLILSFSSTIWINSRNGKLKAYLFSGLFAIIHAIFFGYWIGEHEIEIYRKYWVKTNAVVTKSFYSKGERMYYEFKLE